MNEALVTPTPGRLYPIFQGYPTSTASEATLKSMDDYHMIKVFPYLSSKDFSSLRQISILFRNTHSTITQSIDYLFLLNFCFLHGLEFWNSLIKGNRINTQQWFTSDKLQYTHGFWHQSSLPLSLRATASELMSQHTIASALVRYPLRTLVYEQQNKALIV